MTRALLALALAWVMGLLGCGTLRAADNAVMAGDYATAATLYAEDASTAARLRLALLKASEEGGSDLTQARALVLALKEHDDGALPVLLDNLLVTLTRKSERAAQADGCAQAQAASRSKLNTCKENAARATAEASKLNAELATLADELARTKRELDALKRIDLRRR